MEKHRINEIFLGLIFVVLLIIMILSFVSVSATDNGKSSSYDYSSNKNAEVTDSYNTYNYFSDDSWYESEIEKSNSYSYLGERSYRNYYEYDYSYKPSYKFDYDKSDYSSKANHKRYYGLFENEVNKYKVSVRNKGHEGNYYKVNFYLTDYSGNTRTESVSHYIKPHESRNFVYRNVFNDGKEYKYWSYKIVPFD